MLQATNQKMMFPTTSTSPTMALMMKNFCMGHLHGRDRRLRDQESSIRYDSRLVVRDDGVMDPLDVGDPIHADGTGGTDAVAAMNPEQVLQARGLKEEVEDGHGTPLHEDGLDAFSWIALRESATQRAERTRSPALVTPVTQISKGLTTIPATCWCKSIPASVLGIEPDPRCKWPIVLHCSGHDFPPHEDGLRPCTGQETPGFTS